MQIKILLQLVYYIVAVKNAKNCIVGEPDSDYNVVTYKNIACPMNTYSNERDIFGFQCPEGKTTLEKGSKNLKDCKYCLFNYKYIKTIENDFKCTKCPHNKLASLDIGHNSTTCDIDIEDNEIVHFISNSGDIKNCNDVVKHSIGRDLYSEPDVGSCKCHKGKIIAKFYETSNITNNGYICIEYNLQLNIFNIKRIDYGIKYFFIDKNFAYFFINCPPFRKDRHIDICYCACPYSYILYENKCQKIELDIEESKFPLTIKRCDSKKIISFDGQTCICPYSIHPQDKDCNKCSIDSIGNSTSDCQCSGNFKFINNKCKFCNSNKIKSNDGKECVCPNSTSPLKDYCEKCKIEEIDYFKCYCRGNSILKDNKCQPCIGNYLVSDDRKSCICPIGSYQGKNFTCIKCPIGTYMTENTCKKCRFFLTTKNNGSVDIKECDTIKLVSIYFVILCIIILILFTALIFLAFWKLIKIPAIKGKRNTLHLNDYTDIKNNEAKKNIYSGIEKNIPEKLKDIANNVYQ